MRIRVNKNIYREIGFFFCIFYTFTRACLGAEFGRYPFYLYLIIMGLYVLAYFFSYPRQRQKITKTPFYLGYFLYILFVLFSILFIEKSSAYAMYEYIFYLLMFFPVCYILNYSKMERMLSFIEMIGVLLSIEAIWEFATGITPYRVSIEPQAIRRACGLVGTPLTLGMILVCISLIGVYRAIVDKRIHYIVAILAFIGLLTTQSRGPLVGFIVGLCVLVYVHVFKQTRKLLNSALSTILKITCILIVGYIIIVLLKDYIEFIDIIYTRIQSIFMWSGEDASNALRKDRWMYGLNIFKNNFLFGYGVSTSGTHATTGINVESGVIKKLMETGIVGFMLYYLTFGLTIFVALKKCLRKNVKYSPLAFAIIISIFIENITLQIIEASSVFMIFIIFFTYLFVESNDKKTFEGK